MSKDNNRDINRYQKDNGKHVHLGRLFRALLEDATNKETADNIHNHINNIFTSEQEHSPNNAQNNISAEQALINAVNKYWEGDNPDFIINSITENKFSEEFLEEIYQLILENVEKEKYVSDTFLNTLTNLIFDRTDNKDDNINPTNTTTVTINSQITKEDTVDQNIKLKEIDQSTSDYTSKDKILDTNTEDVNKVSKDPELTLKDSQEQENKATSTKSNISETSIYVVNDTKELKATNTITATQNVNNITNAEFEHLLDLLNNFDISDNKKEIHDTLSKPHNLTQAQLLILEEAALNLAQNFAATATLSDINLMIDFGLFITNNCKVIGDDSNDNHLDS